jgi:ATP-dependent DNA ligase
MAAKEKINKKKLTSKRGDYCIGKAVDLADPAWQARAQEYRRKLSASMRPLAAHEIHDIPRAKSLYVVKKYDGEFTYLFFDGEELISVNPGGTVRIGLPCYKEAEKLLKKAKVRSCVLAGELYALGDLGNRNKVQEIVKLLRKPATDAELKRIGLAVFDIVDANGKDVETASETFKLLEKWFGKGKLVAAAEHRVANEPDDISDTFTDWVIGEGAEGIVVRHDRLGYYKIKLRHNLDAAIIGFSEGTEKRKGMLHDMLVAVIREDGTFHETARVGGGFTEEDRRIIFDELKKRIVPSEYVAVNNDYVAYEMIEPGPVVEISFLDLIPESSKGDPVKRMVLDWDGKQYGALSRMPLVSVISPQFVRIRDDKEANVEDVNIRQLTNLVKIADAEKPARAQAKSPSKLLERTVYKKTMRGASMVRKLLLWKTNKEETGDFPGYVVYLTDFSPNRIEPLQRDIKISNNEKTARQLFAEMAKKHFVGGWEKVA